MKEPRKKRPDIEPYAWPPVGYAVMSQPSCIRWVQDGFFAQSSVPLLPDSAQLLLERVGHGRRSWFREINA